MIKLNHRGRWNLTTEEPEITKGNVISVLRDVWNKHCQNAQDCDNLIAFEAGNQPLGRVKTFRPDINWEITSNLAAYIVDFKLGFIWGNPITLVQRGNESTDNRAEADAISMLNECYAMSGNDSDTQELARFIEICGIGYSYVDINMEWEDGESYFTRDILDPRKSFVVKSNYYTDKRPMLGVSYRIDSDRLYHFTCFTRNERFEIVTSTTMVDDEWKHTERSGEPNPLGKIPIIEWIRSFDRQGCFERQLEELEKLNLLASDAANAIDQNVLAVWHANDVEFPKKVIKDADGNEIEQVMKPESGDWVHTFTSPDGKQPFIKPLTMDYGLQNIIQEYNNTKVNILTNCHVPQRNDDSGGSTGIAMSDAAGWSDAESIAQAQERITNGCKMEEVKVVLSAIRESTSIARNNPMLMLKAWDLQPNTRRPKNFEMSIKANSIATLLSHGFALEDVVATIPLFEDPAQIVMRSGEGVRKYQETLFHDESVGEGGEGEPEPNSDRLMQDYSDQIENSPQLQNIT